MARHNEPQGGIERVFAMPWSTAVSGVQDNVISRLPERTGVRLPWRGAREGEVMAAFTGSGDLQGAEFVDADLRGARFRRAPSTSLMPVRPRGRHITRRIETKEHCSIAPRTDVGDITLGWRLQVFGVSVGLPGKRRD